MYRSMCSYNLQPYLIVQNADSSKEVVALGQTYFAIQTTKQEVLEEKREKIKEQKEALQEKEEKLKRFLTISVTRFVSFTISLAYSSISSIPNLASRISCP